MLTKEQQEQAKKTVWECPFERIRDYPDCFEDCPDTDECQQGKLPEEAK